MVNFFHLDDVLFALFRNLRVEILLTLFLVLILRRIVSGWSLPPGPWGLPFVGYLPFMGTKPHETFLKLSKKYGPIFGLTLGQRYTVVLNDYASITEAFRRTDFNARPPDTFHISENFESFEARPPKEWADRRKFITQQQRTLIKSEEENLEELVHEQTTYMLTRIKAFVGKPYADFEQVLEELSLNIMTTYTFGRVLPQDHHLAKVYAEYAELVLDQGTAMAWTHVFPSLRPIIRRTMPYAKRLKKLAQQMEDFYYEEIDRHVLNFDPERPKDFMDRYLLHMEKLPGPNFSRDKMNADSQMILIGGFGAAQSSLQWMLLGLSSHQDIQEKVYKEVCEVFGSEKRPSWSEREQLPYTLAVIHESQRWRTIVPTNTVRWALNEVYMGKYRIPKGSVVLANNWAVHNDDSYWDEPEKLKPERFLNAEGKLKKGERLLAFSHGKKKCVGKDHALVELFLVLTSFIQKFKIVPPEGWESQDTGYRLINQPDVARARFELR